MDVKGKVLLQLVLMFTEHDSTVSVH